MPQFAEAFTQLGQKFRDLPTNTKILSLAAATIFIGGIMVLSIWLNQPNYQVLYSRLSPEDAGSIVSNLKEQKIPYQLKQGGTTILVPEERVYELRLQLATDRVFQKGNIGFELFDQTNFGTTEFVQTINYQRALQGELGRTISSLAEIEWARVHLAIPQKSLFMEEEQLPTASVVIKLKPGASLRQEQIQGIVHLVSCSVEGLLPDKIKVIDDQGRILSSRILDYTEQSLQMTKMEYQHRLEDGLEQKITGILEKALGPNKVIAKVSANLNLKRVESTEEKYDPERTVVKTEQRTQETAQGQTPITPGSGADSNYQKADETIQYELTKAVNHIVELPGQITRLSVAVLIDGIYEQTKEGAKYLPRPPEEMKHIQTIVEKAVGYDPGRGDQVEVVNIPFQSKEPETVQMGLLQNRQLWLTLAKYGSKALGVLFFLLFLFRPLLKWLYSFAPPQPGKMEAGQLENQEMKELEDSQEAMIQQLQDNLPSRVDNIEMALKSTNNEESKALEALVNAIREIAKQEPKRIAQMTHEWLQEERKHSS